MGLIDHAEVVLRQRVAAFAERGFTLIPDALSAAELSSLNRTIDDDRAGRATQLCVAHHTPVPRRLAESSDTVVRHLFGRRLNNSTLELLGLKGKL